MSPLVLDTNYIAVSIVDSFKSLIWVDRYNSYGDFELYSTITSDIIDKLKEDYYLCLSESEHYMIIEDLDVKTNIEDGNYVIITGRSLECILERRIVWGQKTITGNLQNGIKSLIDESIVNPEIADRKIPNFVFQESSDPKVTEVTISDTQITGGDLYSVIKKLCYEHDLGFKIILNDSNQFVFSLYAGIDRSYSQSANPYVVFSPGFENIINSNYYTSKSHLRNVTLVAGEGEGSSRKTAVVGSASGLDRREIFTDARDISSTTDEGTLTDDEYLALLESKGNETLKEYTTKTAFDGEVEATRLFKYGEDFFIGDIVQIEDEYGHEGKAYISELVMTQSQDETSILPTFQTLQ